MNLNLKLLGDLQVYDLPYLSLYMDEASHTFYLAFRITPIANSICDYIVAPVQTNKLIDYLQQKVTMRNLFEDSDVLYNWHKQRGKKGGFSITNDQRITLKIDNSTYNPLLCEDEEVIRDYISGK